MKLSFIFLVSLAVVLALFRVDPESRKTSVENALPVPASTREIAGTIKKGETLFDIFDKYGLDMAELFKLKEASASVHKLRELYPGHSYRIIVEAGNRVRSFTYWIDDDSILDVDRRDGVYQVQKTRPDYETRIGERYVVVRDNLTSSIGEDRQDMLLALQLSDIFAWSLDFTADLQNGDVFKIIVEELYLGGNFKKYADVLSAEFVGNEGTYRAYRFEWNGKPDYYDDQGMPLKKAFLKAPLSFRRISSGFARRRLNPVLKIYRPHYGIDYAAPMGAPVSAVGSGTVVYSGRRGEYGKLIIIRHRNGYTTRYGHLSRFAKGIRRGTRVAQGDIIGYVGRTGLATGPHLHFEMRINGRPMNPFLAKIPRGDPLPETQMAEFRSFKVRMDKRLAAISPPDYATQSRATGHSHGAV
jgi:murein DD-endopeptidase MepM/ murein hydrolase activator NlpD